MAVSTKRNVIDLEQGKLERHIYVDQDVYQQELEQVFGEGVAEHLPRIARPEPERLLPVVHGGGPGDRDAGRQGRDSRVPEHVPAPWEPGGAGRRREREELHVHVPRVDVQRMRGG